MNKEPNFPQNYFSTYSLVQFSDNIKRLFMNSAMANIEIHNWSKWGERMYGMIIHKVNTYIIPSSHPGLRNHCGIEGRKISRDRDVEHCKKTVSSGYVRIYSICWYQHKTCTGSSILAWVSTPSWEDINSWYLLRESVFIREWMTPGRSMMLRRMTTKLWIYGQLKSGYKDSMNRW